MKGNGRSTKLL